jgi:hypothetical protein
MGDDDGGIAVSASRRTHVLLPEDLLAEIDAAVGPRHRSEFLIEAAREKLRRRERLALFRESVGSLAADRIPEWATPESSYAWVRAQRAERETAAAARDDVAPYE